MGLENEGQFTGLIFTPTFRMAREYGTAHLAELSAGIQKITGKSYQPAGSKINMFLQSQVSKFNPGSYRMLGVKPYVSFKGNCAEAIKFYGEALGAEVLFCENFGNSPMKGMAPDDQIMHCTLKIGNTHLMACDNPSCDQPTVVGNNISLAIGTDDAVAADRMFQKMSQGGNVVMPLQETFWAVRFGMLIDKFGINWMFNVDKPASAHAQATAEA